MSSLTKERAEQGSSEGAEAEEERRETQRLSLAAPVLGPRAVWASVDSQPPLTEELALERSDFVERAQGGLDQT